jgi:hypothetical protein
VATSRQKRQQAHQAHPGEQAQHQSGQEAQVHAGQQANPEQARVIERLGQISSSGAAHWIR